MVFMALRPAPAQSAVSLSDDRRGCEGSAPELRESWCSWPCGRHRRNLRCHSATGGAFARAGALLGRPAKAHRDADAAGRRHRHVESRPRRPPGARSPPSEDHRPIRRSLSRGLSTLTHECALDVHPDGHCAPPGFGIAGADRPLIGRQKPPLDV
jgi:hypothetical protein